MDDFAGRVILITGAAGNLGNAVARAFQKAGAKTVLIGHSAEKLKKVFYDIYSSPDHLLIGGVDLTDADTTEKVVDEAYRYFHRVDVLFNAIGTFSGGKPVHEEDIETWEYLFKINFYTTLFICRAVIPYLMRQGSGKIINTASRSGVTGLAKYGAYSASKSGVLRLTESLAEELKSFNINVNCIIPGTIDTPQNREEMPNADYSKWVKPSDIADVVLFLASEASRAITGAAIPVYGLG